MPTAIAVAPVVGFEGLGKEMMEERLRHYMNFKAFT